MTCSVDIQLDLRFFQILSWWSCFFGHIYRFSPALQVPTNLSPSQIRLGYLPNLCITLSKFSHLLSFNGSHPFNGTMTTSPPSRRLPWTLFLLMLVTDVPLPCLISDTLASCSCLISALKGLGHSKFSKHVIAKYLGEVHASSCISQVGNLYTGIY